MRFTMRSNQISPLIEVGNIRKRSLSGYRSVTYQMVFLDKDSLTRIMGLQKTVVDNLENPELFEPLPIDCIDRYTQGEGRIIGVLSQGELIAYDMMSFPGENHDNLGYDLKISRNELMKLVHLEAVVVHPVYRGNNLHFKMQEHLLNLAQELGYHHIASTISPSNYPSLSNFLESGLVIKQLKTKYGNKLRYIVYRNFKNSVVSQPTQEITLLNTDIRAQQDALKEGFVGYKIRKKNLNCFEVIYIR